MTDGDPHAREARAGATPRVTFLFADLAGYTALTDVHGDERGADVAADFCEHVQRLVDGFGGELVKSIGDGVMLRVPEGANAVRLALTLAHHEMRRPGHPAVRVGMDTGRAVERGGDWFGSTVNVAARLCALAGGGEVLVTESTRSDAGGLATVRFEDRGDVRLRNVRGEVRPFRVSCDHEHDGSLVVDPVCRMAVDAAAEATEHAVHDGVEYRFCSPGCRAAFSREPAFYAEREPGC